MATPATTKELITIFIGSIVVAILMLSMVFICLLIHAAALHPSTVDFHVTQVSLTQFNLTNNNTTLHYNLKVNITAYKKDQRVEVYYKTITAIAWYKDKEFCRVSLAPFFDQGQASSPLQPALFQGHSVIDLAAKQIGEYNMETIGGVYHDLGVDLDFVIRTKKWIIKSGRYSAPIVRCGLMKVPLVSNGKSGAILNDTKCTSSYFFKKR